MERRGAYLGSDVGVGIWLMADGVEGGADVVGGAVGEVVKSAQDVWVCGRREVEAVGKAQQQQQQRSASRWDGASTTRRI